MSTPSSSRPTSWLTAFGLLGTVLFFGVMAGGLIATRVLPAAGMGWDQLASLLGGLMVGAASAIVVWIVALRTFAVRNQLILMAASGIGGIAILAYLLIVGQ